MKRKVVVALILIAVAVVAIAAAVSAPLLASNLTVHDQSAIRFGVSLNSTTVAQGQAVRVSLEDWNTLGFKDSLPLPNGVNALNLSSGPCGGPYPGGIAVYQGAYGRDNVTSATLLPFYAPGTYYVCPALVSPSGTSFIFNPHQNVTTYIDLMGYYTRGETSAEGGGVTPGVLHPYQPGVYTVIAGDAFGNVKVMYFRVTAAAVVGAQERTGPVSAFPASWLASACTGGGAGNVTTGVYLGLNSSASLDHIDLGQVYAQMLNSSSFAYHTVGHGWVVSEWTESAAPGGYGQVVASFILTSGGAPSGYLFASYDPMSGAVNVASLAAPVAGCPTA
ncbi:MAG: hypothetical protein ABSF83_00330 [Nitrososphaerales archaeon]|jgi:hypothetical protein